MASIRIAQVQDAAAIAHVHVLSWQTTYQDLLPEEYLASLNEVERVLLWQDWLTRDIDVFVAEVEGRVVGFAGGGPVREPIAAYDAELYTIYLLQEVQGRGIGKRLSSPKIQPFTFTRKPGPSTFSAGRLRSPAYPCRTSPWAGPTSLPSHKPASTPSSHRFHTDRPCKLTHGYELSGGPPQHAYFAGA